MKGIVNRPGFQTSEWWVALATAALTIANDAGGWISWKQAILPTLAGVAYVVSRGLAKYEPRNNGTPTP